MRVPFTCVILLFLPCLGESSRLKFYFLFSRLSSAPASLLRNPSITSSTIIDSRESITETSISSSIIFNHRSVVCFSDGVSEMKMVFVIDMGYD
ncbi:hypothetical protein C5167_008664 [Papaver somniferum]|uniref:Secreted protein n=1 Tax=Papaver somniferum TaxID=3469 RepID=A0A4Y7JZ46_PAPSO|nr:hypothetical protein C5167_008664 [Papaver somniferum]